MDLDELRLLRRARDRMDREYAQPLDVAALARTALMSTAHFARRFREAYGETPYSYLMTRRIERAKALLRRGDMSVTDVCFDGRLHEPRLLLRALHGDRRRHPERVPRPRPRRAAGRARLPDHGADTAATTPGARKQDRRSIRRVARLGSYA